LAFLTAAKMKLISLTPFYVYNILYNLPSIAIEPSLVAAKEDKDPLKPPRGVRTAAAI
jgi:hypothetical protein